MAVTSKFVSPAAVPCRLASQSGVCGTLGVFGMLCPITMHMTVLMPSGDAEAGTCHSYTMVAQWRLALKAHGCERCAECDRRWIVHAESSPAAGCLGPIRRHCITAVRIF
jgi:hypothetical protein